MKTKCRTSNYKWYENSYLAENCIYKKKLIVNCSFVCIIVMDRDKFCKLTKYLLQIIMYFCFSLFSFDCNKKKRKKSKNVCYAMAFLCDGENIKGTKERRKNVHTNIHENESRKWQHWWSNNVWDDRQEMIRHCGDSSSKT